MDFGEVDNICSGIILLIWKKQPFYTIFKFAYDKKFKFKTDLVDFTTSQEDFIENLKENLEKNGLKECFSSNLNLCYFKYEFGKLLEIKRDEILSGKNVVFVEDDGNINWLFGDGALDVLGLEE
ncbi:hypothetical protein [Campylobacter geochelonis]|uniref:hypothetical protein n=1 Tax=Campylobacter geochelonis TaxID=1780362 RepID=UPI000770AEAA|nr:hypothetical protein [Campylobacter geochelonis]CZE46039.1 Uncharacterised protein [Campylobacter geochelonis]